MSGFAAIVDWTGAAESLQRAEPVARWLAPRGADGVGVRRLARASLVHAHAWTTPEEVGEEQPAQSPCGNLWITAHARIDNRAELLPLLRDEGVTGDDPDSQFILGAYRRWGTACADRLVGEFAFALWDERRQALYCARDPLGVRSLLYCRTDGASAEPCVVAAGEMGALLAGLPHRPPLHRPALEDMLACAWERSVHETVYQGVFRLPPGYHAEFDRRSVRLERYWLPRTGPAGGRLDEREAFDAYRRVLERAVSDRLRSRSPVGIAVSGGLDSSSIACIAARHAAVTPGAQQVRLYSMVFSETPGADEQEYFEAVARQCSELPATRVPSDDCWALRPPEAVDLPADEPGVFISRTLMPRLLAASRAHGCGAMLIGLGGDQLVTGEPYHSPHLLRGTPLARVPSELPHFRRASGRPGWWILAVAYGLSQLPEAWRAALSRSLLRHEWGASGLPLREPSRAPLALPDALKPPPLADAAVRESYRQLTEGLLLAGMAELNVVGAACGVEWRYPFFDRRLVELVLGMPAALRFRDGVTKRIVRQALREILPPPVLRRRTNSHFSGLVERGLRHDEDSRRRELLRESVLVTRGLLDGGRLERAWRYWEAHPEGYCSQRLYGSLLVEEWLRMCDNA